MSSENVQKGQMKMYNFGGSEPGVRTYSWTPKGVEINVYQRTERASTKGV